MAIYNWSSLTNNANVSFNPDLDQLIFDTGIDSYLQLADWDLQAGFSTFTDLTGKTVTLIGLGALNISPTNLQFESSVARFLVGDLSASALGDSGANNITGTDGNDVIMGYGGGGSLSGGAGNDLIYAMSDGMWTAGLDTIDGGTGVDWFIMDPNGWESVTANLAVGRAYYGAGISNLQGIEGLAGSGANDRLIGDAQDNFFRGKEGDDQIYGRGGVDWVYYDEPNALGGLDVDLAARLAYDDGFGGMDTLVDIENVKGGHLDDLIVGSGADNVLWGEAGNDTLIGGYGSDTLRGGLGDDLLQGAYENGSTDYDEYAELYGYPQNINVADYADAIGGVAVDLNVSGPQNTGGAGTDTLLNIDGLMGSQFADTLTGNARNNALSGSAGNDSLYGGAGKDTLSGGAGDDLIDGGAGLDTASYADATAAVTVNLTLTGAQATGGGGADTLVTIENLLGSAFNDALTGNAAANRLHGAGGNDTLNGGGGNDWLQGGTGADVLNGGLGIDTVSYADALSGVTVNLNLATAQNTGGGGTDRLTSVENVEGSAYDDVLTAHASGSRLYGGQGNNTLIGGAGNDVLSGTDFSGSYYGTESKNTVSYAGATDGVTVDLSNNNTSQDVGGGQGWDTLIYINRLIGSNFEDALTSGYSGDQHLEGGAGNDRITAYQGHRHDTLDGGAGVDTLVLDEYFNNENGMTLDLGSTEAQFYESGTQVGSMTLSGFENAVGSNGNDNITGSAGNNVIEGGGGNDTLDGGAGIDTLSYANTANHMIWSGVTASLAMTSAQDPSSNYSGIDTISGFENLIGTYWSDTLSGNAGANVIEGGDGDDTIDGGAGLDTASYANASASVVVSLAISGSQFTFGAGADTLIGMERLLGSAFNDALTGNNVGNLLTGGMGADLLTGAEGADQFVFAAVNQSQAGGSYDTITDFTAAQNDKINLLTIDANSTLAGNQAFSFIGTDAFSAAGQLRFEAGMVYANVDADLGADLQIELTGVGSLTATSFVL